MKSARQGQLARLWRAEAFSPKDFFRRAAFLAVACRLDHRREYQAEKHEKIARYAA